MQKALPGEILIAESETEDFARTKKTTARTLQNVQPCLDEKKTVPKLYLRACKSSSKESSSTKVHCKVSKIF